MAFAAVALARFDVLHYHDGTSYVPVLGYLDVRLARRLRRRRVIEFWGSDVRIPAVERARNPFYEPGPHEDGSAVERIKRWAELTDGHVIAADHFADAYLEPSVEHIHVVGQRVDVGRLQPHYPDPTEDEPLVVHAPSNSAVKGTEHVRAAIESLERRGRRFRYVELTGMRNAEVTSWLGRADLVVDQLRLGVHGVLAAEAMALGKPVLCRISPELRPTYPAGLPVIDADPITVEAVLDDWLHRPAERATSAAADARMPRTCTIT